MTAAVSALYCEGAGIPDALVRMHLIGGVLREAHVLQPTVLQGPIMDSTHKHGLKNYRHDRRQDCRTDTLFIG